MQPLMDSSSDSDSSSDRVKTDRDRAPISSKAEARGEGNRMDITDFNIGYSEATRHVCNPAAPCSTSCKCGSCHRFLPLCLFTAKPDFINVKLQLGVARRGTCVLCRIRLKHTNKTKKRKHHDETTSHAMSTDEELKVFWEKIFLSGHNVRLVRRWNNLDGSTCSAYKCFCHSRHNSRKKRAHEVPHKSGLFLSLILSLKQSLIWLCLLPLPSVKLPFTPLASI